MVLKMEVMLLRRPSKRVQEIKKKILKMGVILALTKEIMRGQNNGKT